MKNLTKVLLLYLLIGILLSCFVTFTGGYHNLVLDPVKISLTTFQYVKLMLFFTVFWFPILFITVLSASETVFPNKIYKLLIIAVMVAFVLLTANILKKEKK